MTDKERFELEMMDTPQLAEYMRHHVQLLNAKIERNRLTGSYAEEIKSLRSAIKVMRKILQNRQLKLF